MWLRPGFIYENQLLGIDTWLLFVPRLASGLDIRAILFAGVQRLFLKLIPCRRKNRHTIETLALDDFSASRRPRISSNVRSGSASISVSSQSLWAPPRRERKPPPDPL